eukprot:3189456-Prymnesium_polylepis.1
MADGVRRADGCIALCGGDEEERFCWLFWRQCVFMACVMVFWSKCSLMAGLLCAHRPTLSLEAPLRVCARWSPILRGAGAYFGCVCNGCNFVCVVLAGVVLLPPASGQTHTKTTNKPPQPGHRRVERTHAHE